MDTVSFGEKKKKKKRAIKAEASADFQMHSTMNKLFLGQPSRQRL